MKIKKINICIIIFLLIVGFQNNIYGKYVIQNSFEIATVTTDEIKPVISLYSMYNTNLTYKNHANKTHTITVRIKVLEKNIKINNLMENTKILVGGIEEKDCIESITRTAGSTKMSIFDITLRNLIGNGELILEFAEKAIIDIAGNTNDFTSISTGITIDNIAPNVTFEEILLENGKVEAKLSSNENFATKETWTRSSDLKALSKEFPSNISYPITVYDFAQNPVTVNISITKATFITLNYGSYNSGFEWSFNSNESLIAGKQAIEQNPINKTEMLAFRTEGNVDEDFLQVQAYIHTYWGENAKVISDKYSNTFCHGYNPTAETYSSMLDGEKVSINQNNYFIIGGDGLNREGKTSLDINSSTIPKEIAKIYPFGISGIKAKLKDDSNYSIVYQIFVNGQGWQKASCDGEESTYAHDKPISGFKMAIIPKTEKEEIMQYWNKDM